MSMQPGSGENQINFELPQAPRTEAVDDTSLEEMPIKSPETRSPSQSVQASSAAASSMALPSSAVTVITDDTTSRDDNSSRSQAISKGEDRIDKIWVDKTKSIITKTKDDPYEQKRQISQVKAEYIKSRFNKTIRSDDAVNQ